MNSIIYDHEIIIPKHNMWNYYKNFTNKLDQRNCVKFSLFCAKIINDDSKESNDCIGLVEKWLINEKSVTSQELLNAAVAHAVANVNVVNAVVAHTVYTAASNAAYAASLVYYAASLVYYAASLVYYAASASANAANAVWYTIDVASNTFYTPSSIVSFVASNAIIDNINRYLQILLRKTKQFQNNKILEQISKTDVDKLELVDWNMITDIMQEEYNIVHEFNYEDIFSRRCLIELLRGEYL